MEGSPTLNPTLTPCVEGTLTLALCILHGGEGTLTRTLTYTHNVARTLSNALSLTQYPTHSFMQGSSKHCLTAPHSAFYWPEWKKNAFFLKYRFEFSQKLLSILYANLRIFGSFSGLQSVISLDSSPSRRLLSPTV